MDELVGNEMPGRGAAPHWPALDGLRGLAVAGVVAFHLGWLGGGFLGVDLFFTLSGFLITSLLVREAERDGGIDLVGFWGRRFRRLLPAVALLVAVVLAWLAWWGSAAEQALARDGARWALPYLGNWHQIAESHDYWAGASGASAFTHLWSLAIEEQFYVVWPLVVWLVVRAFRPRPERVRRVLIGVTALGAVASAAAMAVLHAPGSSTRAYMGTDTRACSLLLGALAALVPLRAARDESARRGQARVVRGLLPVLALAALLASWVVGGEHLDALLRGGLVVHAALAAWLVRSLAGERVHPSFDRALGQRPMVWLGQRSYGLYLWHWPVIVLVAPRLGMAPGVLRDAVLIAISLALTIASYALVEQPIRRRIAWARAGRASWATAAAMAIALVVTVVAPDGRGDVATFAAGSIGGATGGPAPEVAASPDVTGPATTPPVVTATPPAAPHTTSTAATTTTAGNATPTTAPARANNGAEAAIEPVTQPAPAPPRHTVRRVLWVGDSVAADEAPAIAAALAAAGVETVDAAFAARRLVDGDDLDVDALLTPIVAEADADLVAVQLSLWDSPFPLERQRAALTWFRDLVVAHGAHVVFVAAPPVREDLVDAGMARQIELARTLAAEDPEHVQFVDTASLWGTTVDADMDDDGAPDRKPDLVHICPQGAARFAAWFVDELAARYDGITPVFPTSWVGGDWSSDDRYDTPAGACAALPRG